VPDVAVLRIDFERFVEIFHGVVVFSESVERECFVVEEVKVFWIDFEGFVVVLEGFVVFAEGGESERFVV